MLSTPFVIIGIVLVVYGLLSIPLSKSIVSAPMMFMGAGIVFGPGGLHILDIPINSETLEGFAEVTLGLILFADAASTNARRLISDNRIPLRLLLISLPLTIAFGGLIASQMFPDLAWAEWLLIAAILAPTDAALGLAVVSSPVVPERIRQAILVESGLNDGLALPAVLLFAALAYSETSGASHGVGYWLGFAGQQIIFGILVGVIGGLGFGKLVQMAHQRGWVAHNFRNLTSIGVALILLFGSHLVHGNGFIAAFVGGLTYGAFSHKEVENLTSFVEEEGQLFSLLIFFFFGAVILPDAIPYATAFCLAYALLSLTVIRLVPTYIGLIGSKISLAGRGFIGWFGPRGLASILFLFIAVGDEDTGHGEMSSLTQVEAIVYLTVALSIILHGATASFFSRSYGNSEQAKRDCPDH